MACDEREADKCSYIKRTSKVSISSGSGRRSGHRSRRDYHYDYGHVHPYYCHNDYWYDGYWYDDYLYDDYWCDDRRRDDYWLYGYRLERYNESRKCRKKSSSRDSHRERTRSRDKHSKRRQSTRKSSEGSLSRNKDPSDSLHGKREVGKVIRKNDSGFGFIWFKWHTIFFHLSGLVSEDAFPKLKIGDKVEFDVRRCTRTGKTLAMNIAIL